MEESAAELARSVVAQTAADRQLVAERKPASLPARRRRRSPCSASAVSAARRNGRCSAPRASKSVASTGAVGRAQRRAHPLDRDGGGCPRSEQMQRERRRAAAFRRASDRAAGRHRPRWRDQHEPRGGSPAGGVRVDVDRGRGALELVSHHHRHRVAGGRHDRRAGGDAGIPFRVAGGGGESSRISISSARSGSTRARSPAASSERLRPTHRRALIGAPPVTVSAKPLNPRVGSRRSC